ncbi:hypothetical protein B0T20DRAFT_483458 [Sordaria brevicollis]|uniref:NAD(P)-binding protein n=1 Tax=Sordaria brevicollis TaxID=83679 RepID=A0AAE0P1S3_SORBR|nr:hypothetical protein B0T20DRAFT_483458 [Sordaria brevicollis]
MTPLVWLVTGATSGIGRATINEIISRGDKVIASGRNVERRLGGLKSDNVALFELDITSSIEILEQKVQEAWGIFGHIDVLFNNAGMSSMKSVEESDEAFTARIFQTNLFAPLTLTRLFLPLLRSRAASLVSDINRYPITIAYTSSAAAWTSLPFLGTYSASKAALSSYVETLHKELRPLGIRCVSIECGGFPTNLGQPRSESDTAFGTEGTSLPDAYGPWLAEVGGMFMGDPMKFMPGDLAKVGTAIVDVVKKEGAVSDKKWVGRVLLGTDAYESVVQKCEEMVKVAAEWKAVSFGTDREEAFDGKTDKRYLKFTSIVEGEE